LYNFDVDATRMMMMTKMMQGYYNLLPVNLCIWYEELVHTAS